MIMFTTAKGLFIIRGSEIQQLLSFDETVCENNSPIAHHDIDSTLIPATTDQTTLSQFIQGRIIAYNTIEKELICCRPDLKYSLIIHIPSMMPVIYSPKTQREKFTIYKKNQQR